MMLNPVPVPAGFEPALEPPELRGLQRDEVRLLVADRHSGRVSHTAFRDLADYLEPGDLVVVNESGTLAAGLDATRAGGDPVRLHLSTRLPDGRWVVEVRRVAKGGTIPFGPGLAAGERLELPTGAVATLESPHRSHKRRLWDATLELPAGVEPGAYVALHGGPIRYSQGAGEWPLRYYQTVFSRVPGSAEMPSAGRAFTPRVLSAMDAKGVGLARLVLHTGVSSLEDWEPPYEEWFRVPARTADAVNRARRNGGRVVAVGTTVVRALETVTAPDGTVRPGEGWTDLVISPERGIRAPLSVLSGFHEPRSSHLALLSAIAGSAIVARSYLAAMAHAYLGHEFGDLHLIL